MQLPPRLHVTLPALLALGTHGYLFAARLGDEQRDRLEREGAVEVPLLGSTALLVTGAAGVRLFYDAELVVRSGAVPAAVARPLFGSGAVHGLDGTAHAARKALFLSVLDREACEHVADLAAAGWERRATRWAEGTTDSVHAAAVEVFGEAALDWAGIAEPRPAVVAHRLAAVVDGFGVVGPAYLRAWRERSRLERWARRLVSEVRADHRSGIVPPSRTTPLRRIALARDEGDDLLPVDVAAVELLNLLRPTVAVAWLATFLAVALVEHPDWRRRLQHAFETGDGTAPRAFAHEVRRHYPFVPALAARARRDTEWNGFRIRRGQRVLLDVHGTDHGADWDDPWAFRPERFLGQDPMTLAAFVPQGGGRPETGHRCPGEGVTTALLVETARVLVREWPLAPSAEDLTWSTHRMPTRPPSGVRIAPVRHRAAP